MGSPISRMGGKKLLRKEILKRFPDEPPGKYVEVFGGIGWVLFASEKHAPMEVFNDIGGDLINLYRCMKHHRGELQKGIRWMLNSREMFEDAREQLACRGFYRHSTSGTVLSACKRKLRFGCPHLWWETLPCAKDR